MVISGLATIRPRCPFDSIILYTQQCHPERSEGSAVAFESLKAALIPSRRPTARGCKSQIASCKQNDLCEGQFLVCFRRIRFKSVKNSSRSKYESEGKARFADLCPGAFRVRLFAGFDTFGFAFGIGDGGGQVSLATGTFLISTLAGGVGLVIAALGSWTRWQGATVIALVSVIIVLPAAVLYACQNGHAFWMNTQLGMHFGLWAWPSAILPPFLDVVAAGLSWVRLRR